MAARKQTAARGRIKKAGQRNVCAVPDYDTEDAAALKAFHFGRATEAQQRRAYDFIVMQLCGIGDISFRPGPGGALETAFAEGKRWVAAELVKFANMPLRHSRETEQGAAPQETVQ